MATRPSPCMQGVGHGPQQHQEVAGQEDLPRFSHFSGDKVLSSALQCRPLKGPPRARLRGSPPTTRRMVPSAWRLQCVRRRSAIVRCESEIRNSKTEANTDSKHKTRRASRVLAVRSAGAAYRGPANAFAENRRRAFRCRCQVRIASGADASIVSTP